VSGGADGGRELAVGLCVRPADGALLVEHGRDRLTGARFYRAIGGGRERGEAAADAVVREWREEFALAVRVVRALGTLDNRFVYEGRAGRERVTAFEVAPDDPRVYGAAVLEGRDPAGRPHTATWVAPAELRAGAVPLYPAGVLDLLRAARGPA
jgi:8-oxo-dGTP pyrophosphatase MutT (NUDIX family)